MRRDQKDTCPCKGLIEACKSSGESLWKNVSKSDASCLTEKEMDCLKQSFTTSILTKEC